MSTFEPDYRHLVDAAWNRPARRLPLYEHLINTGTMEKVLGEPFPKGELSDADVLHSMRMHCEFYRKMGYDTVSFECGAGGIMPGSGALGGHKPGAVHTMQDMNAYPWDEIPDLFFLRYDRWFNAFRDALPAGMKGVGGVGNGVFECVQDIVGYEQLCLIKVDDPDLYSMLFARVGEMLYRIWTRFLPRYGDAFCVPRMGDDLGFKSETLLSHDDIRAHILPQYRRIVDAVHATGKPFLLHSCGNLFGVMEDIITMTGINAKHSNEDIIAPFTVWVERYGDRIGNFGGIDTDNVCRMKLPVMREHIRDILDHVSGRGGIAFSTGNSIPDYVPLDGYLTMVDAVRGWRGE